MPVNLQTLPLSPEELESAEQVVRQLAYMLWLEAGRPLGMEDEFWLKAEQEWLAHHYVPRRMPENGQ